MAVQWGSVADWLGVVVNGMIAAVAVAVPIREAAGRRKAEAALQAERDGATRNAVVVSIRLMTQLLEQLQRAAPSDPQPVNGIWGPLLNNHVSFLDTLVQRPHQPASHVNAIQTARTILIAAEAGLRDVARGGPAMRRDYIDAIEAAMADLGKAMEAAQPLFVRRDPA